MPLPLTVSCRACLDQHLIAIRSREVLGDHVRSKSPVIAITPIGRATVQTRPTADTIDSYINLGGHADTLIPHTPGGGMEWESRCCSCSSESVGDVWWDQRSWVRQVGWVHWRQMAAAASQLMTVSGYTEMEMTHGVHGRFFLQSLTTQYSVIRSLSLTVTNRWTSAGGGGIRASISQ